MKPAVDGGLYGLTVCAVSFSGGAEEIRTPGLDNANVARSQLRYSPLLLVVLGDFVLAASKY